MNPDTLSEEQLLDTVIEIEQRRGKAQRMRVPSASLFVDDAYQRRADPRRIEKMATNWNPAICGSLIVSYRKPGRYAVIDGQHRWFAGVQASSGAATDFDCDVHTGLSVREEAYYFWFYNASDNRRPMSPLDVFRARLAWEEPQATEIQQTLAEFALHVPRNAGGSHGAKGAIAAVAALDDIARLGGRTQLRLILTILTSAYDLEPAAYRAGMLRGLDAFLARYQTHENFQHKRLVEKLQATPVRAFDRAVLSMLEDRSAGGVTGPARWGTAMMRTYNSGLRFEAKKLPEWNDPAVAAKARWRGHSAEQSAKNMRDHWAGLTPEQREERVQRGLATKRERRNGADDA